MNKIFSFLVSGVHFDSQVVSPNLQTHTLYRWNDDKIRLFSVLAILKLYKSLKHFILNVYCALLLPFFPIEFTDKSKIEILAYETLWKKHEVN